MSATRNHYQLLAEDLAALGYDTARRQLARHDAPSADISALALLAAGLTPPQVRTLFQISARLQRHATNVCNRPVTDAEHASAERDERVARLILTTVVQHNGPPLMRSTVLEVEFTGLPGGASIKVRLRLPSGEEIAGNDFGDNRFICI